MRFRMPNFRLTFNFTQRIRRKLEVKDTEIRNFQQNNSPPAKNIPDFEKCIHVKFERID